MRGSVEGGLPAPRLRRVSQASESAPPPPPSSGQGAKFGENAGEMCGTSAESLPSISLGRPG